MYRKKGFTLVELLVVILIVGILAGISIPLLRDNTKRAIVTEAIAALGTIKSAQRMYYAEHRTYLSTWGQDISILPGINAGDLTGHYFNESCYMVNIWGNNIYIYCFIWPGLNDTNDAPGAAEVTRVLGTRWYIYMDQDGNVWSNIPGIS